MELRVINPALPLWTRKTAVTNITINQMQEVTYYKTFPLIIGVTDKIQEIEIYHESKSKNQVYSRFRDNLRIGAYLFMHAVSYKRLGSG